MTIDSNADSDDRCDERVLAFMWELAATVALDAPKKFSLGLVLAYRRHELGQSGDRGKLNNRVRRVCIDHMHAKSNILTPLKGAPLRAVS